jgi:hypothetical protein
MGRIIMTSHNPPISPNTCLVRPSSVLLWTLVDIQVNAFTPPSGGSFSMPVLSDEEGESFNDG